MEGEWVEIQLNFVAGNALYVSVRVSYALYASGQNKLDAKENVLYRI